MKRFLLCFFSLASLVSVARAVSVSNTNHFGYNYDQVAVATNTLTATAQAAAEQPDGNWSPRIAWTVTNTTTRPDGQAGGIVGVGIEIKINGVDSVVGFGTASDQGSGVWAPASAWPAGTILGYRARVGGNTGIGTGGVNAYSDWAYVTLGPQQSQTVTVTPATAEMPLDGSVTLTASGGQNGYVWTVGNGGGVITGSGATVVFTATAAGSYSVGVYSPEGNGYAESNVADALIEVGQGNGHWITVNETNTSGTTLLYRLIHNGQVIATWELAPGETKRERYQVEDDSPGTIEWAVKGFDKDGSPVWTNNPVPNYRPGQNVTPTPGPIPNNNPLPTNTQTVVPAEEQKNLPKEPKKNSAGLWVSITPDNKNGAVTAVQSAEGTDKILGKLDELIGQTEGAGTPFGGFPTEGGEGSALSAEASVITGAIEGMMPTAITLPTSVGQDGLWSLTMPVPYLSDITFKMDLTQYSAAMSGLRAMLLACECIGFFFVAVSIVKGAFA